MLLLTKFIFNRINKLLLISLVIPLPYGYVLYKVTNRIARRKGQFYELKKGGF